MYCNHCGAENNDGAQVCRSCGAVLNAEQNNAQPVQQQSFQQQPVQQQPTNYVTYTTAPQQPVDPNGQPDKPPQPANGLAIAGMICGIAGIALCCYGFIPAIVGLVLGIVAKKKGNTGGMATAGVICGAIGLALSIVMIIIYVCIIGLGVAAEGVNYYYN